MFGRRPVTRLEAGLYAGIAAIFAAVLLARMFDLFEDAERAAFNATLTNVQTGLTHRLAVALLDDDLAKVTTWPSSDPFAIAGMRPSNHLGPVSAPRLADLERGKWLFDPTSSQLIYLPRWTSELQTQDPDLALRFRLDVSTGTGGYSARMRSVNPYAWPAER